MIGTIASPSRPSVKFTAFDEPTTINPETKHQLTIPRYTVVSFRNGKAINPANWSDEIS